MTEGSGPHAGGRVATGGASFARARLAVIAAHGRGGSPEDMLSLGEHAGVPDIAWLAPEAGGRSWWPQSFLAPIEANEPGLSSALAAMEAVRGRLEAEGFGPERTVVLGFSQGACLALEHAARTALPYRAVLAFSGGLVGTGDASGDPGEALYGHRPKRFDYGGRLDGVPVTIGCHERDPHIPLARVRESEDVLRGLGATVETRIFPGAGHGVVAEEIAWLRAVLNAG